LACRGFSLDHVEKLLSECPADHVLVIPLQHASDFHVVDNVDLNKNRISVREFKNLMIGEERFFVEDPDIGNFWYFPVRNGKCSLKSQHDDEPVKFKE